MVTLDLQSAVTLGPLYVITFWLTPGGDIGPTADGNIGPIAGRYIGVVVVVVVVDPTPPTCCQQSPAPESCGSQQSLPPGGKERLHFVGIRPEVQARKGGW